MICDLVGQVLLGWLLADLLSGLFHWWQDVLGDVAMPIIGPTIIQGAREHHADAEDFLKASLLKRNRGVWAVVLMISLAWVWILGPSALWASATLAAALSGEIHVLAHRPAPKSLLLRSLRAAGLLQSPAQHFRHHTAPSTNYCVVTNWLNPALDELGAWRALETGLSLIGIRRPA